MTSSQGLSGLVALAVGALATLAVASPADAASDHGCTHANTHHVIARHGATRITLLPGQCVELRLRTASDGGYAWHTTQHADRSVARVVGTREVPIRPAGSGAPIVGGYSNTYYLITRTGTGRTVLALRETQAGHAQKDDPTFVLTIRGAAAR